ncbi:MAG: hypothetical protein J5855_07775 [Mailhella sp.]|nr:hypothetical protein [Mailhella sp.]
MPKLPFKIAICKALEDDIAKDASELKDALSKTYPGERQVNEKEIERHLLALKGVGIAKVAAEDLKNDELVQKYVLTVSGKKRLQKMIGKSI